MRPFEVDKLLIGFLRGNLIILLPLTVLLIQLIVRWMAREEPKEVFRSVLTVPLDIVYIAISFVLSGLARLMPRFSQRYASDRDTDLAGAVLVVALTGVAVLLTLLGRGARLLWQKYYAALQQVRRRVGESDFDWKNPGYMSLDGYFGCWGTGWRW